MTRRVQHRVTGNTGTASHQVDHLTAYDGDLTGPWLHVQFDDGLSCWVRSVDLVDA